MTPGKTIDTYLDLFHNAIKESLAPLQWPIAAFAGLISTGLVIQGVFDAALFLRPTESLQDSFNLLLTSQFSIVLVALNNLITKPTATVVLTLGAIFLATIALLWLGLLAMQFTLSASNKSPKASFKSIRKNISQARSFRLFGFHALRRILTVLIIAVAVLPLSALLSSEPFFNVVVYTAFFLVALPLTFTVQSVAMKASFITSKGDHSFLESIRQALSSLKDHWLSTMEFNIFLYAIVLSVLSLGIFLGGSANLIIILGMDLLEQFTAPWLVTTLTILIYSVALIALWLLSGFMVLFSYNAWEQYLKSIKSSPIHTFTDHLVKLIKR